MKSLALALLVAATTYLVADDLAEVTKAAKAAKAKRKTSTTRVITNADVRKSKGKVVENKLKPLPVDATPSETTTERHMRLKKENAVHAAQLEAAEKAVGELEAELVAIEQKYYEENDLDRRDGEIVKRFNDTKKKLDVAREELSAIGSRLAAPEADVPAKPSQETPES